MFEYFLFLVFAILLSMLFKPQRYGTYVVIVSFCLGILAFNMEVSPASDLTGHYSYCLLYTSNAVVIRNKRDDVQIFSEEGKTIICYFRPYRLHV